MSLAQTCRRADAGFSMIFADIARTSGNTPMAELTRLSKRLPGRIVAKLEMRNPCGSVKDRIGVAMIERAEEAGLFKSGATLIEATGGNTAIGLAFVAAVRGYRLILTMPETVSAERIKLLRHLGAEVFLTPGILMHEAVARPSNPGTRLPARSCSSISVIPPMRKCTDAQPPSRSGMTLSGRWMCSFLLLEPAELLRSLGKC